MKKICKGNRISSRFINFETVLEPSNTHENDLKIDQNNKIQPIKIKANLNSRKSPLIALRKRILRIQRPNASIQKYQELLFIGHEAKKIENNELNQRC